MEVFLKIFSELAKVKRIHSEKLVIFQKMEIPSLKFKKLPIFQEGIKYQA